MKKIVLILLAVLLCYNLTIGQNTLDTLKTPNRNLIVTIGVDTFGLVPKEDIEASKQKYLQDEKTISLQQDSIQELLAIIESKNKEIDSQNRFIVAKDTTYYTLKRIYNSLQKDYNNLKTPNKLNGILGGEFGASYNTINKVVQSPYIALNGGLMFKRKYLTTIKVGFDLNQNIVFGLGTNMIF